MPVFSVIIPTFNNANYIIKTLESVFSQTFSDYEVIIIDDGSTDTTKQVIKPYLDKVKYYYQKNQGVAVARNHGIERAQGEFIAFLDADDFWFPNKLEIQLQFLQKYEKIAGACTDFSTVDSAGEIIKFKSIIEHYPIFKKNKIEFKKIFSNQRYLPINSMSEELNSKVDVYYGNIFKYLFLGNFIKTSSFIVRKENILEVGKFNESFKTQEDYEYWLRLSEKFILGYIDYPLLSWRKHDIQLTRKDQRGETIQQSLMVIQNISSEAAEIFGKKTVNKRLSEKYRSLGIFYLGENKKSQARSLLKKSIYNYFNVMSILFYFWSFVPYNHGLWNKVKEFTNLFLK